MREAEDGVPDFVSADGRRDPFIIFLLRDALIPADYYHFGHVHDARAQWHDKKHKQDYLEVSVHNSEVSWQVVEVFG